MSIRVSRKGERGGDEDEVNCFRPRLHSPCLSFSQATEHSSTLPLNPKTPPQVALAVRLDPLHLLSPDTLSLSPTTPYGQARLAGTMETTAPPSSVLQVSQAVDITTEVPLTEVVGKCGSCAREEGGRNALAGLCGHSGKRSVRAERSAFQSCPPVVFLSSSVLAEKATLPFASSSLLTRSARRTRRTLLPLPTSDCRPPTLTTTRFARSSPTRSPTWSTSGTNH